jgi:hypothetical protein
MSVSSLIADLAPAFASDLRIASFTSVATQLTSRTHFGENYELAVALRVCHMIARNPTTEPGDGGPTSSKTEDGLSQSFAVSPEMHRRHGDLCSTSYGLQLADLIDGKITGHLASGDSSGTTALQGEFL